MRERLYGREQKIGCLVWLKAAATSKKFLEILSFSLSLIFFPSLCGQFFFPSPPFICRSALRGHSPPSNHQSLICHSKLDQSHETTDATINSLCVRHTNKNKKERKKTLSHNPGFFLFHRNRNYLYHKSFSACHHSRRHILISTVPLCSRPPAALFSLVTPVVWILLFSRTPILSS